MCACYHASSIIKKLEKEMSKAKCLITDASQFILKLLLLELPYVYALNDAFLHVYPSYPSILPLQASKAKEIVKSINPAKS